jgi:hypothetical protein
MAVGPVGEGDGRMVIWVEECEMENGQIKQYVVDYGLFGFDLQGPSGILSFRQVSSTFKMGSVSFRYLIYVSNF